MSFETITKKLLNSVKKEIKREEHIDTINNDIIKPIVNKVLEQLITLITKCANLEYAGKNIELRVFINNLYSLIHTLR